MCLHGAEIGFPPQLLAVYQFSPSTLMHLRASPACRCFRFMYWSIGLCYLVGLQSCQSASSPIALFLYSSDFSIALYDLCQAVMSFSANTNILDASLCRSLSCFQTFLFCCCCLYLRVRSSYFPFVLSRNALECTHKKCFFFFLSQIHRSLINNNNNKKVPKRETSRHNTVYMCPPLKTPPQKRIAK